MGEGHRACTTVPGCSSPQRKHPDRVGSLAARALRAVAWAFLALGLTHLVSHYLRLGELYAWLVIR